MKKHQLLSASLVVGILAVAGVACGGGGKSQDELVEEFVQEIRKSQNSATADSGSNPTVSPANTRTATKGAVTTKPASTASPTAQPTKSATTAVATQPPAPQKPQTVNGLEHRGAGAFNQGEAVIGYEITIGGLRYRQCYFAQAPGSGTVKDGVVNPWPGEVIYSACGAGVEDPDTVNGKGRRGAGSFTAGEAVVGYEITISGLKHRLCYMAVAPNGGTVADGVINPYPGEVKFPPCGQGVEDPDTVNGKGRRGPGNFNAGEAVTGFFTLNGVKYQNCYLAVAPYGGTVTDGVINPWKQEAADDKVCN